MDITDKYNVLIDNKPSDSDNLTFSHFNDLDLSLVKSEDKRTELLNILHSEHADHYSRLWFVGFLRYVGYTQDQICQIIDQDASWEDYDSKVTWLHVNSVFRSNNRFNPISLQVPLGGLGGEVPRGDLGGRDKPPCVVKFTQCKDCPELKKCGVKS